MENGNKKLLGSSLWGVEGRGRFEQRFLVSLSQTLLCLVLGVVSKARDATSHGGSLQKLQWNSRCEEQCSEVPMTVKAICWVFAL